MSLGILHSAPWCPLCSFQASDFTDRRKSGNPHTKEDVVGGGTKTERSGWGRVHHVICVTKPQGVTAHHIIRTFSVTITAPFV